MASFRIPRGYKVNRPPYVEICEGQRPNVQSIPLEAYTGLGPVRIDQLHHDPIVIDAGTIIGIATGSRASGDILPAMWNTGLAVRKLHMHAHSDGAEWGLPTTSGNITPGNVKPLGVCYQPIYSFRMNYAYSNYQRSHNVGFVTDYVIQIAARTTAEHLIKTGDVVMLAPDHFDHGMGATDAQILAGEAGRWTRYESFDSLVPNTHRLANEMVVGRCLKAFVVGSGTASTKFSADTANIAISTDALAEFKGMNLVETRGTVSGSGTLGIPGHMLEGYSDSGGEYRALTILVRM